MKAFTLISVAYLSSIFVGCASVNQGSVLEERAGYNTPSPNMNLSGAGSVKYVPSRVPEKVIVPWLHAKELPSKDYFWGAWLSVVVMPESWEMKKVNVPKTEKAKAIKRTPDKPTASPPKLKKP